MYGTQFPQLVIANIKTILFADGSTLLAYYKYRTNWPAVYIKSQFVTVSPVWVKLRVGNGNFGEIGVGVGHFTSYSATLPATEAKFAKMYLLDLELNAKVKVTSF